MTPGRFCAVVVRYRHSFFALWLLHLFVFHYHVLGMITWDGFGHRGVPVVELLQHGTMNKDHYYEWSLAGYFPVLELVHIPFLYLFGMTGFLIGFPLIVFPLCTTAMSALVRELTGDERAAMFGGLAYAAMPMINQQPFSAYIDFAVSGLLAFVLWSILRLRAPHGWLAYLRLVLATALFTLARVQGLYVLMVLLPVVLYVLFVDRTALPSGSAASPGEAGLGDRTALPSGSAASPGPAGLGGRTGRRWRIARPRALLATLAAVSIGALPSVGVQIWKYLAFDSPSYPVQFEMFGIKIGHGGISLDYYFQLSSIGGHDWPSVLKGALDGWLWHPTWPISAFFSSQYLAAGLLAPLAVILFVAFARRFSRLELVLLATLIFVSLLSRDLAVPRWAYTIVTALVIVLGRALSALADAPRARPAFWLAMLIVFAHLLRPELDYFQFRANPALAPRMNVTGSRYFYAPSTAVTPIPDRSAKLVIIDLPASHFALPLFGRKLSNEVLATIPTDRVGPRCAGLAPVLVQNPDALFVDDYDHTRECQRTCAILARGICRAYRITPGP